MKKTIPVLAGSFIFCFVMAFSLRKDLRTSPENSKLLMDLNPNLYTLVIDSPSKNAQLLLIATRIDNADEVGKKIVFQFFFRKDTLILAMYLGKRNHKNFDADINIKLRPVLNCTQPTINDLNIYLGDLEIRKQVTNWPNLEAFIKDPTTKYLVFKPGIATDPVSQESTITYEIYSAKNDSEICIKDPKLTGVTTNPAPPRGGN